MPHFHPKLEKQRENVVPAVAKELVYEALIDPLFIHCLMNVEAFKSFNKPVTPKLHGKLPRQYAKQSNSSSSSLFVLRSLRKGENTNISLDCPSEVDGVKVEADLMDPELAPIHIEKLSDQNTILQFSSKLKKEEFDKGKEQFYSWNYPTYILSKV